MVEELICAGLQCFGQHIVNGLQALGDLFSGVNLGSFESSKRKTKSEACSL